LRAFVDYLDAEIRSTSVANVVDCLAAQAACMQHP
jgi:hypothetical protein